MWLPVDATDGSASRTLRRHLRASGLPKAWTRLVAAARAARCKTLDGVSWLGGPGAGRRLSWACLAGTTVIVLYIVLLVSAVRSRSRGQGEYFLQVW